MTQRKKKPHDEIDAQQGRLPLTPELARGPYPKRSTDIEGGSPSQRSHDKTTKGFPNERNK